MSGRSVRAQPIGSTGEAWTRAGRGGNFAGGSGPAGNGSSAKTGQRMPDRHILTTGGYAECDPVQIRYIDGLVTMDQNHMSDYRQCASFLRDDVMTRGIASHPMARWGQPGAATTMGCRRRRTDRFGDVPDVASRKALCRRHQCHGLGRGAHGDDAQCVSGRTGGIDGGQCIGAAPVDRDRGSGAGGSSRRRGPGLWWQCGQAARHHQRIHRQGLDCGSRGAQLLGGHRVGHRRRDDAGGQRIL